MSLSLVDFTKFVKTSFKHGSLIIAIFIPIMLLLDFVNFVSTEFMLLINAIIIVIELVLATSRLVLNEFLKAKTLISEVNKNIRAGMEGKAKSLIKDHVQETIDFAVETAKQIKGVVKSKVKKKDTSEPAVPEPLLNKIKTPEFSR